MAKNCHHWGHNVENDIRTMFLNIWFFFFISTRNFWKDTDRHANNTWWKISYRFLTVKYVHTKYMFNIGFFEQNHSKIGVMSAFWISNNYNILCYRRAKSPFGFLIKWCIALQVCRNFRHCFSTNYYISRRFWSHNSPSKNHR